jgi:DNA-binding transcriptional ArsR family regulator
MPDPADPPGLDAGAAILIDRFEAETAAIADLRARVERAELARERIRLALQTLLPALPPEQGRAIAARLDAGSRAAARERTRALEGPQAEALCYLAACDPPRLTTGDLLDHLRLKGFAVADSYAAKHLGKLAQQGLVTKSGHGRWRVNRRHPEIMLARVERMEALGAMGPIPG